MSSYVSHAERDFYNEEKIRRQQIKEDKTPAQAFTPPADEKKMGAQSGYLCTTPSTAQAGADAGISWS